MFSGYVHQILSTPWWDPQKRVWNASTPRVYYTREGRALREDGWLDNEPVYPHFDTIVQDSGSAGGVKGTVGNASSFSSPSFWFDIPLALVPGEVDVEFRFEFSVMHEPDALKGALVQFTDYKRPGYYPWALTVDLKDMASKLEKLVNSMTSNEVDSRGFVSSGSFIAKLTDDKVLRVGMTTNLNFDFANTANLLISCGIAVFTHQLQLRPAISPYNSSRSHPPSEQVGHSTFEFISIEEQELTSDDD